MDGIDQEADRLSVVYMANAQDATNQLRADIMQFPQAGNDLVNRTTDRVADRVSNVMINNPDLAADQLRNDLQQLDPQTGTSLIAKIKNDETQKAYAYGPGLGDLQIQPEIDQYGRDTGYRNVTMATPTGIQQIAEIQARPLNPGDNGYGYGQYGPNVLGYAAGLIVGDLLFQQRMGRDFDDDRYRGWCNREIGREQYWNQNQAAFQQNWADPGFRSGYQRQNTWQQINAPHNTYINNRVDTTIINRPVNTTIINETIQQNPRVASPGHQQIGVPGGVAPRPPYSGAPAGDTGHYPVASPGARPPFTGIPAPSRQPVLEPNPGGQRPHQGDVPPALAQQQQAQRARDEAIRQQQEQQRQHQLQVEQQQAQQRQQQEQQRQHQLQVEQQQAQQRQQQEQQRLQEQQRQQQEQQRQQRPPAPPPAATPRPKLPGEK